MPRDPEAATGSPRANTAAYDWSAARGERWRAHLGGMEGMLKPADEPLIRALRLEGSCRIADVGCGGGATALELARRAPAGSVVHGYDISPALLEVARERQRSATCNVDFVVANVATSTPAEPYDRLVSRFGVMFFEEPREAFANLVRWLVPGGRFAFAVWGPTSENPWVARVRELVADIVELPKPDPDAPGPFRYADAGKLRALLDGAGFRELDVREWRGALPIGGGLPCAEAARFALAAFSSFAESLAAAGDEAVARAHRSLTARFSEHEEGGVVQLDACVRIVTGARSP